MVVIPGAKIISPPPLAVVYTIQAGAVNHAENKELTSQYNWKVN